MKENLNNVNVDSRAESPLSPTACSCPPEPVDATGSGRATYPVEWSKLSFNKKLTRKKTRAKKYKAKVLVPHLDDYQEKEVGLTLWPYIKYLVTTNLLQRIPVLRQSHESDLSVKMEMSK